VAFGRRGGTNTGVGNVALGAVQMRVNPLPVGVVLRLGELMGAIPVALAPDATALAGRGTIRMAARLAAALR
jgi:hypothetical protein